MNAQESNRLDRIEQNQDRILSLLEGDDKFKSPGLNERVIRNEKDIEDLKTEYTSLKNKVSIYSGVAAAVATVIINIILTFI